MHRKLYEMEPHEKGCDIKILELLELDNIEEQPTGQPLKLKASLRWRGI
jgi:hypothetical protein